MKKLIDPDELYEFLRKKTEDVSSKELFIAQLQNEHLRRMLDRFATVDADPVRCKDCKWWNTPGCAILIVNDSDRPDEMDFCSFGERRKDDAVD